MRKKVLLLDNYDSFTWNLAHLLEKCGAEVAVVRHDEDTATRVSARAFSHLVISPGPGTPERAGICCALIAEVLPRNPILGVCLGHQALAVVLGARLRRVSPPVHGEATDVDHAGRGLFRDLPVPFRAARYHSLAIDASTLPPDLVVDARSSVDPDLVMAIRHARFPAFGIQFHPESFLTEHGESMVRTFLETSA